MNTKVSVEKSYIISENIVVREIQGEIVIIPITGGINTGECELFTLNDTGRAILDKFDGKRNLRKIVDELSLEFDADEGVIEEDVLGLTKELFKKKMIVDVKKTI